MISSLSWVRKIARAFNPILHVWTESRTLYEEILVTSHKTHHDNIITCPLIDYELILAKPKARAWVDVAMLPMFPVSRSSLETPPSTPRVSQRRLTAAGAQGGFKE